MHAGCILPARSSWLVLALRSSFYLLIFFRHPRKRISSGRRAREWRWIGSMTQGSGGSCVMTSLPGRGWWYDHTLFLFALYHSPTVSHFFPTSSNSFYTRLQSNISLPSIYLSRFVAACMFFVWSSFKAAGEWVCCLLNWCALWFDYFSDLVSI